MVLHGPGDVGLWQTVHQTQQRDISFRSSQHFLHLFSQSHSRGSCRRGLSFSTFSGGFFLFVNLILKLNEEVMIIIQPHECVGAKQSLTIDNNRNREFHKDWRPPSDLSSAHVCPSILSLHLFNTERVIRLLTHMPSHWSKRRKAEKIN